jgi:hypothetical protein
VTLALVAAGVALAVGPGSPAKKDLYVDPIRTIFRRGTWHYDPPPDATSGFPLPKAMC